jgi:phytanoyl-CoA hydroxylase
MKISSYSLAPGDLVLIHGSVLHKSERNTSANTRFAYTFHMIESPPFAVYDEKNWLQPTQAMSFSHILEEAAYVDNSYGLQG